MARQRPTRAPHVEIDRIVIRETILGGCGLLWAGPYIVEIDLIVIRDVQYQFEVNRCRNEEIIVKGNFGWAWPMWAGRPRIDCIVIKEVQYSFEVNRCRNEEIIVKVNFGWEWPIWVWPIMGGAPQVEIDRIVMRGVQYQFEVNHVKDNFGWAWPMWAGRPRIDCIVIREVQYQFEVNQCRNEEIIVKGNFGWAWPMWPGRPRVGNGAMHINRCRNEEVNFQGSSANSVGGAVGQDGRTDAHQYNIPTFSPKNKTRGIVIASSSSVVRLVLKP
ncbi:hypothetical protein DPMN_124124 [Dreissena polymorpha]|uniref:Uncharacterized protein n=1 Tax=Dreissena polymorpha TaxID=45954 RepID=A0A9D4GYW0_DREPO|nr:hypothetical protein DPMN_124124 [Dreissena polymorpha]